MENKMNREEIVNILKTNVCEVTFTKINGEERVMPCTLKEDLIQTAPFSENKRKVNESVVSVWVTDINGWRSFRVDNVKSVTVLED